MIEFKYTESGKIVVAPNDHYMLVAETGQIINKDNFKKKLSKKERRAIRRKAKNEH